MKKSIGYNGPSSKRKFYKIKKHFKIISRRLKFKSEIQKIKLYGNDTLSKVVDSYLKVWNSKYSIEDVKVFENQEKHRSNLLRDETLISYKIFGLDLERTVSEICRISPSPKIWAQFLYCLTKKIMPKSFLEIGTNLGISGSYILEALKINPESKIVTMEGLPQLCDIAKQQFATIGNESQFEIICGLYEDTFPELIKKNIYFDVIFIDGNHQKDPTIEYFQKLKECISNPAVFIIDDIYYNTEMTEAWEVIKNDKEVNYSIDMYKLGIIVMDNSDSNFNRGFELHLSY